MLVCRYRYRVGSKWKRLGPRDSGPEDPWALSDEKGW
jgi:hypothetical protein